MSESKGDKDMAAGSDHDEEFKRRMDASRIKFEENLLEFKSKPIKEIPCFRSTFLTSKKLLELIN